MRRIPFEEAIQTLLDEYRLWLEESEDNVVSEWLERCDQHAEVIDEGGDPPNLFLEVED